MSETRLLLDPTAETAPAARGRLDRPISQAGLRIGLLDISKPRGDLFLDHIEAALNAEGFEVKRYRKPTYARTAPVALQQQIATEVDALVEALAD